MEEIQLLDLYYIIRKRIRIILIITIMSTIVSFVVSNYFITPMYETFTTLMLGKPADYESTQYSYQDILTNQKLIGTYGEIAKSRVVLQKVADNLDMDLTLDKLKDKISINLLNNTEVIKVTVKDSDPQKAVIIADEMAKVFMTEISSIMKINNVQVIDKASTPTDPVSPRVKLNVAIGMILGLMMSTFLVFLIEFLDQTIKVTEDVEKNLDLPVLGMIPEILE